MRDVNGKTYQPRHFKTWSPDWYAVLMVSKLVTNADLNWLPQETGDTLQTTHPTSKFGLHIDPTHCLPTSSNALWPVLWVVPPQTQRAADVPSALPSSRGIIFCRDCGARVDQRGRDLAAKLDSIPSDCRCEGCGVELALVHQHWNLDPDG